MRKIFLFIFFMVVFTSNVNAEACDAYDIKRLKEIAEGVEITYELQEPLMFMEELVYDVYKINITGLTSEIFVHNETDDEYYSVNSDFNKILNGGKKQMIIKANGCSNVLKKITLKLPVYNYYYKSAHCEGKTHLDVCNEWVEEKVTEKKLYSELYSGNDVEENNNFIMDNIVYLIIASILVLLIIIFIIVKRKREVLS